MRDTGYTGWWPSPYAPPTAGRRRSWRSSAPTQVTSKTDYGRRAICILKVGGMTIDHDGRRRHSANWEEHGKVRGLMLHFRVGITRSCHLAYFGGSLSLIT